MRGHITKRGKNSYSIVVSGGWDADAGKYNQVWETIHGSHADAERRRTQILSDMDKGIFARPGKVTLSEWLAQWLKDRQPTIAPSTFVTYQFMIRKHIGPSLGSLPLSRVTPQVLQKFYGEKLAAGLGARSIKYCHVTLRQALGNAVKLGLLARNATDSVEVPKPVRHEMRVLSEREINLVLDMARTGEYYEMLTLLIYTGMRRGEVIALQWQDVDLVLAQLSVRRSAYFDAGKVQFREPKTSSSRRLVSLSPATCTMLRKYREKQETMRADMGLPPLAESDLLFSRIDGTAYRPDTLTHIWEKIACRNGLAVVRLHDLRHSHASLLLQAGVSPKVIQERLGHSSIRTTLDTYSHLIPTMQKQAASRFDQIVAGKANATDS